MLHPYPAVRGKNKVIGSWVRRCIYITLIVFQSAGIHAQTGLITGNISDAKTGETLIGATVLLEGTQKGTITDFNGNYTLTGIEAGSHRIVCSYISYEPQAIAVIVNADEETLADFRLSESLIALEEVEVVAEKRRESEQMLLVERKESNLATESIGARELAQKGASTVADGVRKISGVSMIGSKQLFVRGLGDRYNLAQLNGLPVASPDPNKKVIKLDIFPSEIVEAITVSKVFGVQNYADYTGALIDIETRDYPLTPFIKVHAGTGINTNASFKNFIQLRSRGFAFMGLNTGQRRSSVPGSAKTYNQSQSYTYNIFATDFIPDRYKAPTRLEFALSGGKLFNVKNKQLGVLFSSKFTNDYISEPSALNSILKRDGTNQKYYVRKAHLYNASFSNLLNLSYKRNAYSSITYNMIYLVNSVDEYDEAKGRNYDGEILHYNSGFFESHRLFNNQLLGKHKLNDKLDLSWGLGYALAKSDVPDVRVIALIDYNNDGVTWNYYRRNAQETKRMYKELDEDDFSGKSLLGLAFNDRNKLLAGIQGRYKIRHFDAFFYYFNIGGITGITTTPFDAPFLISEQQFADGNIIINNGSAYQNKYDAFQMILAGFANYIHKFSEKFILDAGLRGEFSGIRIDARYSGGSIREIKLKYTDPLKSLFPALNIRYAVNGKSNLRFSASRSVTRPSFNEMAPAKIPPIGSAIPEQGEEGLQNSYSNNLEARYEIFPNPGELWSAGIYGKIIEDPIEKITKQSGGDAFYTFTNTNGAVAAGIEIEGRKKFNSLFVGFNASYIYTRIKIPGEGISLTNTDRPMQGASPYLVNADLGYEIKYGRNHQSAISLVYNVYGKRIWSVGAAGVGDIYELPFHSLDVIFQNRFNNRLGIDLKARNLTNSAFILTQDYYTEASESPSGAKEVFTFKKGVGFELTVNYTF